jgi:hypothetical protein
VKVPADAMAGTKHVIGVVPLATDTADAKDDADSLLLRFPDQQQVSMLLPIGLTAPPALFCRRPCICINSL